MYKYSLPLYDCDISELTVKGASAPSIHPAEHLPCPVDTLEVDVLFLLFWSAQTSTSITDYRYADSPRTAVRWNEDESPSHLLRNPIISPPCGANVNYIMGWALG